MSSFASFTQVDVRANGIPVPALIPDTLEVETGNPAETMAVLTGGIVGALTSDKISEGFDMIKFEAGSTAQLVDWYNQFKDVEFTLTISARNSKQETIRYIMQNARITSRMAFKFASDPKTPFEIKGPPARLLPSIV
jgi:hypothetical protein